MCLAILSPWDAQPTAWSPPPVTLPATSHTFPICLKDWHSQSIQDCHSELLLTELKAKTCRGDDVQPGSSMLQLDRLETSLVMHAVDFAEELFVVSIVDAEAELTLTHVHDHSFRQDFITAQDMTVMLSGRNQ